MRLLLFLVVISALSGQSSPPSARVPDLREAPTSFRASVDLVDVPVVVRDREGRAVGGLRAEDFQITDNGKEQTIIRFSAESRGAPATAESGAPARAALPPSVMPTRFFAFLIDDLHIDPGNFKQAVEAAGRQLRAMFPGDRSAVLFTSGRTPTGFTNDQEKLQAALAKITPMPPRLSNAANSAEQETRVTFAAVLDAVRRLEVMAGQRKLVLVSPGFLKQGLERDVSHTVQRAIQANVTIDVIEARSLWTTAAPDVPGWMVALMAGSPEASAQSSTSDVMAQLTSGSGGRLFQNSNALDLGFRQAAAPPEYQFTLSYSPQGLKADGKYHALKVSLKGARGLGVEARKGYFALNREPDPAKQAEQEIRAEIFSRNERTGLTVDVATRVLGRSGRGTAEPKYVLAVFMRLDLKTLPLRQAGDRYSDEVRSVAALFDVNGNMVAGRALPVPLNLGGKELEKQRESGLILRTDFELKAGTYLLRVVSRDSEGQRLASRTQAVKVDASEIATEAAEALPVSLAGAKKRSAPAWKPAQAPPPEPEAPEEPLSANIDMVRVPGGLAALAQIVNLPSVPTPENFFLAYCRQILTLSDPPEKGVVPPVAPVASYVASMAELSQLAEREPGSIHLTLDSDSEREKTIRALGLLGWKVSRIEGAESGAGSDGADTRRRFTIEPGDKVEDSSRQEATAALGIDDIAMVNALAAREPYTIVVPSGEAQFIQARLWTRLAETLPPGGFAELFARRPAFAKAYVGLAAMNFDAANAVISALGLRSLVEKYARIVGLFGESFAVSNGRVAVPGGADAQPAWEQLAGASTRDPKKFFRALIQKDAGRLAEFYFAVSQGDPAHRRFFTANSARAARFYTWFREEHIRSGVRAAWQEELLRGLPLDDAGRVRFPGGRPAWTSDATADDEALLGLASLRALVPVARLEEARKAPLDGESARLLNAHHAAWRSLFPYFENLKGLGASEFRALEKLEEVVSKIPRPGQNLIMGQWHSLVKLAELAVQAGSLDDAAAARTFRHACEAFSMADHSATAVAVLREMLGNPADPDEAVPAALLRLDASRRGAFEEVKELQLVPSIASAGDSSRKTLLALAGLVYAATLDPDSLLLVEDPQFLSRHQFTHSDRGCGLFCPSKSDVRSGSSRLLGGFTEFGAAARIATREKVRRAAPDTATHRAEARIASASRTTADFQVSTRVVEAYATVTYGNGRYADGLSERDFKVLDDGKPVSLSAFENDTSAVSVALLLDLSRSMTRVLGTLRKSAFSLVGNLRPIDPVAVYGFSDSVSELQPWTLDKDAAKRALLRPRVMEDTELHDALLRLIHELSGRKGKNVIVVFTDGNDTASALGADTVVRRAKENSIRIYTIAEGDALKYSDLLSKLKIIATATGGLSFAIREAAKMTAVFETISRDVVHGYLLTIQPDSDPSQKWHALEVSLTPPRGRAVRARQGYFGAP